MARYEDIPLFDVETPPVRQPKRRPTPSTTARYAKYVVKKPVRCDACMRFLAEAKGEGPIARMARIKRTVGKESLLLCLPHAQKYRKYDEVEERSE